MTNVIKSSNWIGWGQVFTTGVQCYIITTNVAHVYRIVKLLQPNCKFDEDGYLPMILKLSIGCVHRDVMWSQNEYNTTWPRSIQVIIVGCKILEHENKVGEQLGVEFEFKMQLCYVKTTPSLARRKTIWPFCNLVLSYCTLKRIWQSCIWKV